MSKDKLSEKEVSNETKGSIEQISGLYENWFLDYASYVILDRAVPYYEDGLKPVQRRILHTFFEKNDGRYHKIANIIGHTMQYHPHGDASIGDAIINLGQKDLLIDPQGNWGNPLTGDSAAAPRYIEGRLTPFALEVLFNPETTHWVASYDGRNNEPVTLPVKFPLVLFQGVEGIAVGLSTKILPHNFCELLEGSISYLRKRSFELYPDFPGGGIADCTNYNDGLRGGKVKIRALIEKVDNKRLVIREIPFGTTTNALIDSVVSANDKGKIKIRKIEDNTAQDVEIMIYLPNGADPQVTIDALYAFTDCEVTLSPNSCVVVNRKPEFIGAKDLLKKSTDHTVFLLEWELKNAIENLEKKWHATSLEKIFIEKKVYQVIEEAADRENMIELVDNGLKPHIKKLRRPVTREDILKLCEIPIRRISRFDVKKTNDLLDELDKQLAEKRYHLENLIDYAVNYFRNLLKKYGEGKERKTRLSQFSTVSAVHLAVANQKLYVNRKEGFIGTSLRKEEFAFEVSPYDEVVVFRKDGNFMVTKVSDKTFVGKGIIHIEKFIRGDQHRIFNMIYQDGKQGKAYAKRFNVGGITRDREYQLTRGEPGSQVFYLSSNPNGEAEVVEVTLKPRPRIKLNFSFDFAEIAVKGRSSNGNTISKYPIRSVKKTAEGKSTTGPRKMYFDAISGMVQSQEKGNCIGEFEAKDRILVVWKTGKARLFEPEENLLLGAGVVYAGKLDEKQVYSCIYYDGDSLSYFVKRFNLENAPQTTEFLLISDSEDSRMLLFMTGAEARCLVEYQGIKGRAINREELNLADQVDVRSYKAKGAKFTAKKIRKLMPVPEAVEEGEVSAEEALKKEEPIELDLFQ